MSSHDSRKVWLLIAILLAAPLVAGCAEKTDAPPADDGDADGDDTPPTDDGDTGGGDAEAGVLVLGTMMPLTGGLSNLGESMQNGAKLAIKQVNAANLGIRIEATHEDDKTSDTSAAPNTFNRLIAGGATAIAGPCCSGVTGAVLELAKQNEVVVASPSATSPALTLDRENDGYFWRVAPSDAVQGKVLADLVASAGHDNVNLLVVNNAYGNGLARVFAESFNGTVGATVKHDEGATTFASQVDEACAGTDLDAVVLVVYTDEGASILKEMHAKECLGKVAVFASEGVYDSAGSIAQKAGQDAEGNWIAAGLRGTSPQEGDLTVYKALYTAEYNADPLTYSAESFDAVMYVTLAALQAGSTKGEDIRDNLLSVANPPGVKCSAFAECAALITAGQEIDFAGMAHDFEFDENHEPKTGVYIWWNVKDDGTMETTATGKSA